MRVDLSFVGDRAPLSAASSAAAYRVLQEALTNAHKHGDGAASVDILFGDEQVTIEVHNRMMKPNRPADDVPDRQGFGLLGMRERLRMVGGTLAHHDRDGVFVLTASFPRERSSDEQAGTVVQEAQGGSR